MRKYLLLLSASFLLLAFSNTVFAFNLSVNATQGTVDAGKSISFEFNIYSPVDDRFTIHANGLKTWMTIEDIGTLNAGENRSFHLYASPDYLTGVGTYKVDIVARSMNSNDTQERSVFITVIKSVYTGIDRIFVSGDLRPTGYAEIKVDFKNYGTVLMQNMEAYIYVNSSTGQTQRFYELIPRVDSQETVSLVKTVSIPARMPAGKYSVQAGLYYQGKLYSQKNQNFDVISTPVITKQVSEGFTFIGKSMHINITNYGNADASNVIVNHTIDDFDRNFFYSGTGPEPHVQKSVVMWTVEKIEPGESVLISYQINYLPLIIVIAIIIAALWFVFFKVRVVEVRKEAVKKRGEITVNLEVKNRLGKEVDSVILKDSVPLIFRITSFVGMKPVRKRTGEGFDLVWRIRKLKPGEERILSYSIAPVIGVIGGVNLPRAKIMYKEMGNFFSKKSNSPVIEG